jgi:hypothetical protein
VGGTVRLPLLQARLEIAALAVMSGCLSIVIALLAIGIDQGRALLEMCQGRPACLGGLDDFRALVGYTPAAQAAATAVAIAAGASLGTVIVAAELDRRTAAFAWSIAPSRMRWLWDRITVLGPVAILLVVPLTATELGLAIAARPLSDGPAVISMTMAGPALLGQSLLAFAVAIAAGTVLGRSLPTFALALVGTGVSCWLLGLALDTWLNNELADVLGRPGYLVLATSYIDAGGGTYSLTEAIARAQASGLDLESLFHVRELGIPVAQLPLMAIRELAVYLILAIALLIASGATLRRRRTDG